MGPPPPGPGGFWWGGPPPPPPRGPHGGGHPVLCGPTQRAIESAVAAGSGAGGGDGGGGGGGGGNERCERRAQPPAWCQRCGGTRSTSLRVCRRTPSPCVQHSGLAKNGGRGARGVPAAVNPQGNASAFLDECCSEGLGSSVASVASEPRDMVSSFADLVLLPHRGRRARGLPHTSLRVAQNASYKSQAPQSVRPPPRLASAAPAPTAAVASRPQLPLRAARNSHPQPFCTTPY